LETTPSPPIVSSKRWGSDAPLLMASIVSKGDVVKMPKEVPSIGLNIRITTAMSTRQDRRTREAHRFELDLFVVGKSDRWVWRSAEAAEVN
jgi:hypothetical protein